MKMSSSLPQDQVFWYLNERNIQRLDRDIVTDVVVVGGGMAGLSAAQSFHKKGLKVALLEKNYCGSGASGKSSGFITPDSELPLRSLIDSYGAIEAKKIWELITSGVTLIKNNITEYNLDCDYQVQDTLVVANTQRAFVSALTAEHNARQQLQYASTLYTQDQLHTVIGSHGYMGAVTYADTFSIQGYRYCYGMKQVLQKNGVHIYEETPTIDIQDHIVKTPYATVRAEHIIVCTDHFTASLETFKNLIYHAQTFLTLSAPLSPEQIKKIFPERHFLVWDTDMVYHYYRLTSDNRLLLGGASLLYTYAQHEKHNNAYVMRKLSRYFNEKFASVDITFEYIWPGLIGISKDLFPVAGRDATMASVYYIAAAAGLPWATALGMYSAENIINNNNSFDHLLSPYRSFTLGPITQNILGTRLTFALSNFLTVGSL
ncbi:MAG: FAD-binding oxidoreductase [Candidatus Babeliaceae bacterium]